MVGAAEFGAEVGLSEAWAGTVGVPVPGGSTVAGSLSVGLVVGALVELAVVALVGRLSSVGLVAVSCVSTGSAGLVGSDSKEQQID